MTTPSSNETDEHGNKYIDVTPSDEALALMRKAFIESSEQWKKQLDVMSFTKKNKYLILEIVESIEDLTTSIATIDEYFRIKEVLRKQGVNI